MVQAWRDAKAAGRVLGMRFGIEGLRLMAEIAEIENVALLKTVQEAIRIADTPEDLRRIYQSTPQD